MKIPQIRAQNPAFGKSVIQESVNIHAPKIVNLLKHQSIEALGEDVNISYFMHEDFVGQRTIRTLMAQISEIGSNNKQKPLVYPIDMSDGISGIRDSVTYSKLNLMHSKNPDIEDQPSFSRIRNSARVFNT